jgi:hypothetical protein
LARIVQRDSGDTWQVDQSEVGTGAGVDGEDDRNVNDVFISACNLVGQLDDLLAHHIKIFELLVLDFFENSIGFGSLLLRNVY